MSYFSDVVINQINQSIIFQDSPINRIITDCEIIPNSNGYENDVYIRSNCDGWAEDVKILFSYYPDELYFTPHQFIGKTEAQALKIFQNADISYLRS